MGAEFHGRPHQLRCNSARRHIRSGRICLGKYDGEFVPSDAGEYIRLPDGSPDSVCKGSQNGVSASMSVRIVYVFERIEIQEQHTHGCIVAVGEADVPVQCFLETRPVENACCGIPVCFPAKSSQRGQTGSEQCCHRADQFIGFCFAFRQQQSRRGGEGQRGNEDAADEGRGEVAARPWRR